MSSFTAPSTRQRLAFTLALLRRHRRSVVVELDTFWFRLMWSSVLFFHGAHVLAYSYECLEYVATVHDRDWVDYTRAMFGLADPLRSDVRLFVVVTSGLIGLAHLVAAATMLAASVRSRELVYWWRPLKRVHQADANASQSSQSRRVQSSTALARLASLTRQSRVTRMLLALSRAWTAAVSTSSPHFETIFSAREAVEIAAQMVQLFHLTRFVATPWITHVAALVLALNCWMTPLVRACWRHDEQLNRVLALYLDIWLSSFFTILVPFMLYRLYLRHIRRYRLELAWVDPVWIVETGNMLQILVVNTWLSALASRFAGVTMLFGLELAKSIVRRRRTQVRVGASDAPNAAAARRLAAVAPSNTLAVVPETQPPTSRRRRSSASSVVVHSMRRVEERWQTVTASASRALQVLAVLSRHPSRLVTRSRPSRRQSVNAFFLLLGVAVLIIHADSFKRTATARSESLCLLRRAPWFRRGEPCAVIAVNCRRLGLTGRRDEIDRLLRGVDDGILQALLLHDCAALEPPQRLQTLQMLVYIEFVNSTLRDWPRVNALLPLRHPHLAHVVLVRVSNLSTLPLGVEMASLQALQVVESPLTTLPTADGWQPPLQLLVVERCELSKLSPSTASALRTPRILSLAGNALTTLPRALFNASPEWHALVVSGNPLVSWPEEGEDGANAIAFAATRLVLSDTKLASVPQGMDVQDVAAPGALGHDVGAVTEWRVGG
ncbi:hypothetical protein PINS_up011120 [Pythium insidiosum]|nr:hypothetical protein PINS_up011120 [Pythium insidiosum]